MYRGAVVVAFLVVFTGGAALAGTITGVSGLINVPTTATVNADYLTASVHLFSGQAVASLTVGVAELVEVGVYTTNRSGPMSLTAKGVVVPESGDAPGVAVGLDGGATYMVFSRDFKSAKGYLGIGGRYGNIFAGLAMQIAGEGLSGDTKMTLMLEHDGRNVNLGARFNFLSLIDLDIALLNMEQFAAGLTLKTQF